jgi:TIGR03009 family protein
MVAPASGLLSPSRYPEAPTYGPTSEEEKAMRRTWFALTGFLAAVGLAVAQPPTGTNPPPSTPPVKIPSSPVPTGLNPPGTGSPQTPQAPQSPQTPPENKESLLDPSQPLDRYLMRWEDEMKKVQSLAAECVRDEKNKTFNTEQRFIGRAYYMKPNFAILHMQKKDKPQEYEKFICTGTYLYQFLPAQQEIRVHQLPTPKPGQVADDSFLSFMFGMKAEEAKRRYDLKMTKETPDYIYIEITPRFPQDKADFARARLVLNKDSFLPRQLWFEQPNKDEVLWDIPRLDNKANLKREDFAPPATPQGWKLVQQPRVTRSAP